MDGFIQGLVGLLAALAWLVLLVATQFNVVAISAGLLAALYVTGKPAGSHVA